MLASRPLIALAAAFLFWLALPGTFVFDDHSLFVDPAVVPADAWRQWIRLEQTRPLTYITFWFDYRIWGHAPPGFRFTNLLIHAAVASLLFLTARRLFDAPVALTAAALFLFHPLTHEPLLYVFARSSSIAALFCLAAFYFWLHDKPIPATAAFAFSLLAKEEWVAFPLVLLLIDFGRKRNPRWPWIAAMLALSAAAGARVLYATKAIAGSGSGFGQQTTPWNYLLSQGHTIPSYIWRIAIPVQMSIDPPAPATSREPAVLFWIVAIVATALVSWFWAKKDQPGFWLLPSWLLLLPSSSLFPAADAVAWRRLYLPMAFLAIGAGVALKSWPRLAAALVLFFLAFAAARRDTWQSEIAIWSEANEQAPNKLRPYLQLARFSPKDDALRYLDKAKEIAPNDPAIASERGRVWLESGNAAQALSEFGRALALAPGVASHLQNRGVALLALGQRDAARADFEQALRRDPCLAPARENLVRMGVPPPRAACPVNR
ncbi:MAG: hypothetical protein HYX27_10455 [Acidobacteria bacterium]|nr:hypothetical protein [Acidobacteriota bacterium]